MNLAEAAEVFETTIEAKTNEQLGMALAFSAKMRPGVPGWIYTDGSIKPVLAERMATLFCPELSREAQSEKRE